MFISVMPPGQGPCLHSHNSTYETFMVLEGTIEYFIGDPVEHRVTTQSSFGLAPGIRFTTERRDDVVLGGGNLRALRTTP
jgi:quercetin dioxygenase-like cupin family protein